MYNPAHIHPASHRPYDCRHTERDVCKKSEGFCAFMVLCIVEKKRGCERFSWGAMNPWTLSTTQINYSLRINKLCTSGWTNGPWHTCTRMHTCAWIGSLEVRSRTDIGLQNTSVISIRPWDHQKVNRYAAKKAISKVQLIVSEQHKQHMAYMDSTTHPGKRVQAYVHEQLGAHQWYSWRCLTTRIRLVMFSDVSKELCDYNSIYVFPTSFGRIALCGPCVQPVKIHLFCLDRISWLSIRFEDSYSSLLSSDT